MTRFVIGFLMVICVFSGFYPVSAVASQQDEEKDSSAEDEAFERSLKSRLPMNTEQIKKFKQRLKDTERATKARSSPEMTNRSRRLSFKTGEKPPQVKIAPGYVTTISFFDSTGEPWPVTSVVLGNPNYYDVQQPENQSNVITVSALEEHVGSNLALTFKDQDVPTTIQLKTISEGEETDSLAVFRAEQRGPNAKEPSIGPDPESAVDSDMMSFIDNVPPDSAKRIQLSRQGSDKSDEQEEREDVALWSHGDSYYLRTKHPLVWPAWNAVAKGPGGVRVYEMPKVSSLMLSQNGASLTLEVGETFYGE